MKRQGQRNQDFYGTKQIAAILGVAEWRVKNFSEGEAYGLPPSHRIGTGRGSRRLYTFHDLLRIAIADELVRCGFTPEAVGKAVREVPESMLTSWIEGYFQSGKRSNLPLLVGVSGEWRVRKPREVRNLVAATVEDGGQGLFILNFPSLLDSILRRMTELEAAKKEKGED